MKGGPRALMPCQLQCLAEPQISNLEAPHLLLRQVQTGGRGQRSGKVPRHLCRAVLLRSKSAIFRNPICACTQCRWGQKAEVKGVGGVGEELLHVATLRHSISCRRGLGPEVKGAGEVW